MLFASFYFWNSGSVMQTSYQGLQPSMLVQVLRRFPEESQSLFANLWGTLLRSKEPDTAVHEHPLINLHEIDKAWEKLLSQSEPRTYKICIIIDGLDQLTETDTVKFSTVARTCMRTSRSVSAHGHSQTFSTSSI